MDEDELNSESILSEEVEDELFHLDHDEEGSYVKSDLSDEDAGGFSNHLNLEGFSFPGDEKDWD